MFNKFAPDIFALNKFASDNKFNDNTSKRDLNILLTNNDKIGDDIKFDLHVENLPAMAIINGLYPGIGYNHLVAAIQAVRKYQVYPQLISRGFIDESTGIAFIIPFKRADDSFIQYLQRKYRRFRDNEISMSYNPDINFNITAASIKSKLNLQKVYAYGSSKGLHRLAKRL